MQELKPVASIMTGKLSRSWSLPVLDPKFHPSCTKAATLLLFSLVVLLGLMTQEGMVDTNSSVNVMDFVLGATRSINPVSHFESGSMRSTSSSEGAVSGSKSGPAARCLSRAEHMHHRPASQGIPSSPNLVSALRAYEKRHAECSKSHGQNWTETFLRSLSGNLQDNDCQVLIFLDGSAGLGNRLISLVSAFVFALFTNRILLLDSTATGQVASLLCEPFPDSSWLLPKSFPMDLLYAVPDLNKALADDFNGIENVLRLNVEHSQSWGDQKLFCAETRDRIQKIDWVSWTSNQYHVPRLMTFPEFWPRLSTLFPNPSHVFTHLSRYLLLPSNTLWQKILRIFSSYLSPAEKLVGIQIRRHSVDDPGEYSALAFERALNCLVTHNILPSTSSDAKKVTNERLLATSKRQNKKVGRQLHSNVTTVLIASLTHRYAEELRDLYTNFPTTDGSLVRVHMVSYEGNEWHSYEQAQKAFVEMWLLSLSDTIATSSWSTFGYVAQGLGALRPYIVNLRGDLDPKIEDPMHDLSLPNLHCVLGQSPEPCNHYPFWPKSDCGNQSNLTPAHESWLEKHLGRCQDEYYGCQLVQN